uniref:Uncharacterized protein n=1 Tax=Zonotrichia albicollis TaxID=44394 RepID=A0A8D2MW00_ZONAL
LLGYATAGNTYREYILLERLSYSSIKPTYKLSEEKIGGEEWMGAWAPVSSVTPAITVGKSWCPTMHQLLLVSTPRRSSPRTTPSRTAGSWEWKAGVFHWEPVVKYACELEGDSEAGRWAEKQEKLRKVNECLLFLALGCSRCLCGQSLWAARPGQGQHHRQVGNLKMFSATTETTSHLPPTPTKAPAPTQRTPILTTACPQASAPLHELAAPKPPQGHQQGLCPCRDHVQPHPKP